MPDYVSIPLETDADALAQLAFQYLQDNIPGWTPNDPNLEVIMIESLAPLAAEDRDVASDITTEVFKYWGAKVVELPPEDAQPAQALSTWTVADDAGYTIVAGTVVGMTNADGELVAFEVRDDVVIAPGDTVTAAGEVVLVAVEDGTQGNNLNEPVEMIDSLDFVTMIDLLAPTASGLDDEDEAAYLARLSDRLKLFTPTPITPEDFELVSRSFLGIERALALDLYDPATDTADPLTWDSERTVTVVVVDAAGEPVGAPTRTALENFLESLRETNFVVHVIDANYTDIDVDFTATAYPDADPAEVEAAAIDAINSYLSPAAWGQPPSGDQRLWRDQPEVRLFELATILNNVAGLDHVDTLTLNISGDPPGAADVTLAGPAGLPHAGAVSGAVSAP